MLRQRFAGPAPDLARTRTSKEPRGAGNSPKSAPQMIREVSAVIVAAELGVAAFVLRPKSVQDEAERTGGPALHRIGGASGPSAIGRRPGQRQDIVVEAAGLVGTAGHRPTGDERENANNC